MNTRKDISIVVPVYYGDNTIEELVVRLQKVFFILKKDFEIILVEDFSPDQSWEKIQAICEVNNFVKGIKFSRNFGQHYAIAAGLKFANAEWTVVMDCDLQDIPEEIPKLYEKANEGYDIVFAQRTVRRDGYLKKIFSKLFYKVFSYLTDTSQDASIANFGIYNYKVINAINAMGDSIRYFPTMAQWVGFKSSKLEVAHGKREDGKSTYTYSKLFSLAFNNIIAFSDKPLRITVKFGFLISGVSGISGIFYLIKYFKGDIEVLGFTSLIIALFFLSGIIILVLGVIGVYLGKAFDKLKNRPTYIIEKNINIEK